MAWTFKNIQKYGGNTKAIFISGHSTGGYLASMIWSQYDGSRIPFTSQKGQANSCSK
ncbi:hypothetical protein [Lentisphaera profundi]|uniref:hypothetical protein n=1 Tax=Lentisphaera profundi TaxID=1658616 RepID=UPI003B6768A0